MDIKKVFNNIKKVFSINTKFLSIAEYERIENNLLWLYHNKRIQLSNIKNSPALAQDYCACCDGIFNKADLLIRNTDLVCRNCLKEL